MNLKTKLARYIQIEKECRKFQQERDALKKEIAASMQSDTEIPPVQADGILADLGFKFACLEHEGEFYLIVAGNSEGIVVGRVPNIQ